jgi:hypothetical protein
MKRNSRSGHGACNRAIALFLALAGGPLWAAPSTGTPTSGESVVHYDAGFARWLNAPHTVELSRSVTFNQDDAYLKTQAAVVQLDDQQHALNARSLGAVHLYNAQDDLTGLHGEIDFTRHVATLTNNVILVVKPGEAERTAPPGSLRRRFTDPATLTCELMTYDYRHRIGHIPGTLTVTEKDRMLTADSGEYDAHSHVVTLTGHVHGHDADDVIDAPKVSMDIEEGEESITIPVPVSGVFKVRDQDDTSVGQSAPASSGPAAGGK